jgi:hypothetical protein
VLQAALRPRTSFAGKEGRKSMNRKDMFYTAGLVVVAALLLANLFRPGQPEAFTLPEPPRPEVAISAAGDSAWAIIDNKVYFVSLKTRSELPDRIINVINSKELK